MAKVAIQGGVKNYLGNQKQVKVPVNWKSSSNHPTTELAYITKAEKDLLVKKDLHNSLNGKVNRGPAGIASLNGWGSTDKSQNVSGTQMSAAETGGKGHGMKPGQANSIRASYIAAGGTPTEREKKSKFLQSKIKEAQKKSRTRAKLANKSPGHWSQKFAYGVLPNSPKKSLQFLTRLRRKNPKLYSSLDPNLKKLLDDAESEGLNAYSTNTDYSDYDKFSFDDWTSMTNIPGDKITKSYSDFLYDTGSPGVKLSGDVGNLGAAFVKKDEFGNPIKDEFGNVITGYHDKPGGDGPIYYPGYTPNGMPTTASSTPGGEEVDETKQYTYRMTDGNSEVPYALYGEEGYPESVQFQSYLASGGRARRAEGGIMGLRARKAFGGIMDRVTGRKAYGLGSIFKSVKKAASKVLKSDIGKMAILYGAGAMAGSYGNTGNFFSKGMFNPMNMGPGIKSLGGSLFPKDGIIRNAASSMFNPLKKDASLMDKAMKFGKWGLLGYGLSKTPLGKSKPNETSFADRGGKLKDSQGNDALPSDIRAEIDDAYESGDPERIAAIQKYYAFLPPTAQHMPYENYGEAGYRTTAAEGGLMDLGGMEKDYRAEGGFVPIGEYEKKDDVPARLSVNEFVFTADAVRGAGGGDIDKGAEIMENMMENLEKGGTVSEESQGNAGAQQMFDTSERLGEVI